MPTVVISSPGWPTIAAELRLPGDLARADQGIAITDHASSWVRRIRTGNADIYLKTYEYSTWWARLRTLGKRTAPWCKSRAHREFEALAWLRQNHFAAPEPLAVVEVRRLGFLVRAMLATASHPGVAASALLPTLSAARQQQLAAAIGKLVHELHALGFRDRNLDLRNLLVESTPDSFRIAKIDSGRFRLQRPGNPADALAEADWQRLLPQLPPHLATIARGAGGG